MSSVGLEVPWLPPIVVEPVPRGVIGEDPLRPPFNGGV